MKKPECIVVCTRGHLALIGPWPEELAELIALQADLESECSFVVVPVVEMPNKVLETMGLLDNEGHEQKALPSGEEREYDSKPLRGYL